MSKLLFIDIGGTLVDYSDQLPHSAIAAIRAARENGHKVFLSTGRSSAEVSAEIWGIGIDGLIGAHGAYVESAQQEVFHHSLSGEENRLIVDWLRERGTEFYLESNNGLYASKDFEEAAEPVIARYSAGNGRDPVTVREHFPTMLWNEDLYRDDVNKISFIAASEADIAAAQQQFPQFEITTWGGAGDEVLFGGIGVGGTSKKQGVDKLLTFLNASRDYTIAFGDSDRDLSLFEATAFGVAMGEASDALKAAADLVTSDVADDGLAKAFVTLELVTEDQL